MSEEEKTEERRWGETRGANGNARFLKGTGGRRGGGGGGAGDGGAKVTAEDKRLGVEMGILVGLWKQM